MTLWRNIWRPAITVVVIAMSVVIMLIGRCGSAIAATVALSPGTDIQKTVNVNPPGTTFVLRPGIYRENSIALSKEGDSFIGEPGAIMNGAKVLSGWTEMSMQGVDYWTTAGGRPLPSVTPSCGPHGCCLAGYPGCAYVQDLYVDNIDYRHVTSLADVSRMTWYYDFDGTDGGIRNNIYLAAGDVPNSHRVELGDRMYAFAGTAANITIKNLVIEKYAAPISSGAIQVQGPHWLIQGNEIHLNHGVGISAKYGGDNVRVVGNRVHHNGEFGMGGPANGGLWESNYVAYNNLDGVNPDFGAGGTKFVGSHIMIRNNVVHDNYGPGLWSDQGADYDTFDHNTSYNNYAGGIRYEISRYGRITNNTVYGNTKNAQIVYTGSDHGIITGNRVIGNGHGAIVLVNTVGSRKGKVYRTTDVQVTGNTIKVSCNPYAASVGLVDRARPPQPGIFSDPSIFFDHNIYQFPISHPVAGRYPARQCWAWGEKGRGPEAISWSAWQADGQDLHGAVVRASAAR